MMMQATGRNSRIPFIAKTLSAMLICFGTMTAQKKSAPAKPAAPAKAAAPAAKPASGGSGTSAAHGPTTATNASHGPTTATAGKSGPTTSSPTTTSAHSPTTTSSTASNRTGTPAAREPARTGTPTRSGTDAVKERGPMAGHPAPSGAHEVQTAHGVVRSRPDGRPMDVHDARRGMDIHHNLAGGRRVMMDRPGGGRMYYERGRPGYVGRPYMVHGHEFYRRTYYDHGRAYDRFYRPYGYHGYQLDVYVPMVYYPAGFYGWAYQPWGPGVAYAWGFGPSPWYGYYGAYFTPYPVYATPSLWLTDYMISQSLAAAYAAQQANGVTTAAYSGAPLSPETKQLVAQEVQNDIALENSEAQQNAQQQVPDPASSGIARLLSDGQPHVFVASREVDVVAQPSQQECAITDGDIVLLKNAPGPDDTTANVTVLSSKGGQDCPIAAQVAIGLDELSEMNNHLRETVDQGLAELQKKQGTGGLPKAPPSATAPGVSSVVADNVPPPDPAGAKELEEAAAQSSAAESELLSEAKVGSAGGPASPDAAAPAQTVSLEPGESLAKVQEAMGAPTKIVNLGSKSILYYGDTKVTLVGGKVTKVE